MEVSRLKRNVRTKTGLHPMVYVLLTGCMLSMVLTGWIFFASEAYAALQIAVVAFFAAAFLGIPLFMARWSPVKLEPGSFREWLSSELELTDDTLSTGTALTMIMCAPVAGAGGLAAISFIAWLAATGAI